MSLNTYNELSKIVLPKLKQDKENLTELDKKILTSYNGEFMYAFNEHNTKIYLLDINDFDYSKSLMQIEMQLSQTLHYLKVNNTSFVYCDGTDVKEISFDKLCEIFNSFALRVFRKKRYLDDIDLDNITVQLQNLMSNNTNWKAILQCTANPILKKVNDSFDINILNKSNCYFTLKKTLLKALKIGF